MRGKTSIPLDSAACASPSSGRTALTRAPIVFAASAKASAARRLKFAGSSPPTQTRMRRTESRGGRFPGSGSRYGAKAFTHRFESSGGIRSARKSIPSVYGEPSSKAARGAMARSSAISLSVRQKLSATTRAYSPFSGRDERICSGATVLRLSASSSSVRTADEGSERIKISQTSFVSDATERQRRKCPVPRPSFTAGTKSTGRHIASVCKAFTMSREPYGGRIAAAGFSAATRSNRRHKRHAFR